VPDRRTYHQSHVPSSSYIGHLILRSLTGRIYLAVQLPRFFPLLAPLGGFCCGNW
jgi:hypothetical protein